MPIYEYEHLEEPCSEGKTIEVKQSLNEEPLTQCPYCRGTVRKRISRIGVSIQKSNAELRDLGFTKLVKRDEGIYENVTSRQGESRFMVRGQPETLPDFSKTISD